MKNEKLAVVFLCLNAAAFGFFGVKWLMDPAGMAGPLGIVLSNADALTDAQAVYGGLELGLGLYLAWCALRQPLRFGGLLAATLALAGLGLSRLAGIVAVAGPISHATTQLLATDLVGIAVNAIALVLYARSGEK
jgi:hypothetical protein